MSETTVTVTTIESAVKISNLESSVKVTGLPGVKGDKGDPGGTHYTHTQASPATTWTINHNLNKYPSITLLTIGSVEFTADIVYPNKNQAILTIAVATAGIAECN